MEKSAVNRNDRAVAIWIMVGVGMLIVQVLLGGITRLTGSGLSITEWDLVVHTIPPLNKNEWLTEFEKYQQTPQYRLLNSDFSLSDFKSIFFWEWFHRFWGQLIAITFLIPFLIFLIQRRFRTEMIKPLIILFLLGALQGAVGWIMVMSGLTGDEVYVKPAKLAMHFVLASILIGYAFWFGLELLVKKENIVHAPSVKKFTWVILISLMVQFVFGALMAGYKAAVAAPTWPDINGDLVPDVVKKMNGVSVIFENPVVIHFMHRSIAYLILILIIFWTYKAFRIPSSRLFANWKWIPLLLVIIQLLLGIATVITSTYIRPAKWNIFEWMAQTHQLIAIFLFLSLIGVLFLLQGKQNPKTAGNNLNLS